MNISSVRICIPVFADNLEILFDRIHIAEKEADILEIRAESLPHLDEQIIQKLISHTKKEVIFTCRSNDRYRRSERERFDVLSIAVHYASYVDVELALIEQFGSPPSSKQKMILSYHDFEDTPHYWELQKLVYLMNQYTPAMIKIACHVKEVYDVTKLYRLMVNRPYTEKRIIVGMGEKGTMTRIIGPLLGSYLTYASGEWGESAPGQMNVTEMKMIYQTMGIDLNHTSQH